jgi:glutaminyl-tRNA synthetase
MASHNLNMRDPVIYYILHAQHHRTGNKWPVYRMYDYAHGQSDAIERVTHSLCSLEFADHQPIYRWFIEQLGIFPSQQIEFDRLSLTKHDDVEAQAATACRARQSAWLG